MSNYVKPVQDRTKPPQQCEGCGSDNIRTTYTEGFVWRMYCHDCGHWDEEWLEKEPKKR